MFTAAALERELLRIAIDLLQQPAARSKGDVVGRPTGAFERFENAADALIVDAVSLDQAHVRVEHIETLRVFRRAKLAAENLQHLGKHFNRITAVGAG